ncbi:MAG: hypothetical protein WD176_05130, partial [Pirellulales bacterium]
AGRPLEFHCTAPVRPHRAQQILYGPTLEPFLYGEHIGRTLVEKAGAAPVVILTDVEPMLCVRSFTNVPVAMVFAEPMTVSTRGVRFSIGAQHLLVLSTHAADQAAIETILGRSAEMIDLVEPFGRIREAIAEAERDAKSRSRAA